MIQVQMFIFFGCFTVYRGLPASVRKGPFRKWYGHLGELRSLIPKECNVMVLTATATKQTKQIYNRPWSVIVHDCIMFSFNYIYITIYKKLFWSTNFN